MSWLDKLKQGMKKTAGLFSFLSVDETALSELEEAFIRSDMGYQTASELIDVIRQKKPETSAQMREIFKNEVCRRLEKTARPMPYHPEHKPFVILMVGVNGAGKTTTIGKLAASFQKKGLKVSLVAGDTFRAGAVLQLCKWGEKNNCPVVSGADGCDAAALVYDAMRQAKERQDDVLLVDTAGRLQNKTNLMDELAKICRVMQKADSTAPHETILVLDATVGQNALAQVAAFSQVAGLTGLIMTKLDGTAKGGVLLALAHKFQLPVYALGVGEGVDDLQPFTPEQYALSLLGEEK